MSEVVIQPWVNGKIDENGDLHLQDGIDGPEGIYTKVCHTVMSLKQREIHKWLKTQGWATPEEKAELLDILNEIALQFRQGQDIHIWYPEIVEIISKYKGEQDAW